MEKIVPFKLKERIKKRPEVIFGNKNIEGCQTAIGEIIKNATYEVRDAAYGKGQVTLELYSDNSVRVIDNGQGLPLDKYYENENKYFWELVFSDKYGRKDITEDEVIKDTRFSLDNPLISAVQYCSEYMNVKVHRDNKEYELDFKNGENVGGLRIKDFNTEKTSSEIKFKLDSRIFDNTNSLMESREYFETLIKGCSLTNTITYSFRYSINNEDVMKTRMYRCGHRCG